MTGPEEWRLVEGRVEEAEALWPQTFGRLAGEAALLLDGAQGGDGVPVRACEHAAQLKARRLIMCGRHPAVGVVCERCWRRHHRGHGIELALTCAGCDRVTAESALMAESAPLEHLRLAGPGVRAVATTAVVFLAGLALCDVCATRLLVLDAGGGS